MHVLITGANRGIGAEMAAQYRASDQRVTATSRSGGEGFVTADVSNLATLQAASAQLDTPLDMLVCNAGVFLDRGQDLDTEFGPDVWADTFAANVTGVFHTIQAFLPKMAEGGKIAVISSQMGSSERASGSNYVYRASKAAAANLAANLAVDLKPRGIAVGAYHPGWVVTDMGGAGAAITKDVSAAGLIQRFAALNLDSTGCFENYDGTPMPY